MAIDSMRARAQKTLPHIMAMNKDPNVGMKAKMVPGPLPPVRAFAKGGKVQEKLVQFYAKGGAVKKAGPDAKLYKNQVKEKGPLGKSEIGKGNMAKTSKQAVQGFSKGGIPSGKSAATKVMGTIGEAKKVMRALKSMKRPLTRPPGLVAASPLANPAVPPPMKRGGKVKCLAAGGAAKVRRSSPKPNKIDMVNYPRGG